MYFIPSLRTVYGILEINGSILFSTELENKINLPYGKTGTTESIYDAITRIFPEITGLQASVIGLFGLHEEIIERKETYWHHHHYIVKLKLNGDLDNKGSLIHVNDNCREDIKMIEMNRIDDFTFSVPLVMKFIDQYSGNKDTAHFLEEESHTTTVLDETHLELRR